MATPPNKSETLQPASPTDPQYETPKTFPTPAHPLARYPKWLAIVLLLCFLLIFGIGTVKTLMQMQQSNKNTAVAPTIAPKPSPTPDPTSNWKTFESKTHDFSFKYPPSFSQYLHEYSWGVKMGCGCETFNWFDIEVRKTSLSPKEWWNTLGKRVFNGKSDTNNIAHPEAYQAIESSITINGMPAEKVVVQTSTPKVSVSPKPYMRMGAESFIIYLLKHNDSLIIITNYVPQQDEDILFDQILSTFTFTAQAVDTSNWKTFSNANYIFSYPSHWNIKTGGYANSTTLTNKSNSVALTISEGQYPYGFEGPGWTFNRNSIVISINGKSQSVVENIINNTKAYVDFQVDSSKFHVLFGTGYPAGDEKYASLSDYNASKSTLLEILYTLKLTSLTPLPSSSSDNQTVCTMDAKLCPDGSSVGRTGPNCEFAPCP